MSHLSIRRLASGGVITNYYCVSRCAHCLYNSSPRRDKAYLDPDLAETIFRQIAAHGCRSVHIGGGESFLDPEGLIRVATAARDAGMGIDYIETNSAWFVDTAQAIALLGELKASGVHTLLVSISPFHNAHIPYTRVKGVINACRQAGLNVFPWVNAFVRDLTRLDETKPHPMQDFESAFGPDYLRRIPDRYWIHLGGRALTTFRDVYASHDARHILANSPPSCAQALSDTSHFHIDLYGNYIPGLCAGLAFSMADLGRPLAPDKYPLLECLAAGGIQGFWNLATTQYNYAPQRETFLNHCDLCTDIRHFLWQARPGVFAELAPAGFYEELSQ